MVKAVIYLGRSFGMEVIAEGGEAEKQLNFLKKENCAEVQGYLSGKAMPAAEFETRFLSEDKVTASFIRNHSVNERTTLDQNS